MNGHSTAASSAMMGRAHTNSSRVKPRSATALIFRSVVFERNIGGNPAAAFLTVGSVGHDIIRAMLSGRTIHVVVVPRIVGNVAALQIGSVPGGNARRLADQSRQSFCR